MFETLGFSFEEVSGWKNLVILLHQPRHASILAFTRIAFGALMLIDIPQERGMTQADIKYGDEFRDDCQFPMINFFKPLNSDLMALLYTMLVASSFGIMLGFFYRLSCFIFTIIYWYFFLLDKSTWNNHSYLYGLMGFLFLLFDAHRFLSLDGIFHKNVRNSHVPLWNYTLLRFQIFLVYFYAGLKKTELDWLMGYSMQKLTKHWLFDPIRYFMNDSLMDLVVVHYGGFLLDISAGFLLLFDRTRILGFIFCGTFHSLNSQLFNIGMFPYAMLATMFVFCADDSFKKFLKKFGYYKETVTQRNDVCIYKPPKRLKWKQSIAALFVIVYIAEQLFLPYSHFITKGYNGWTEGPYGYSWDMMVHSFKNQHVKITYEDKQGKEGFLKPGAFVRSSKSRWSVHPDMIIQYARCLKKKLIEMEVKEPSVYFDVWKSLNGRFQQRVIDPTVDLANYDWSAFREPTFMMPILTELSDWRSKLQAMKKDFINQTMEVVFVADFPGLSLENFVQSDYHNTTIEVLRGTIAVVTDSKNVSLTVGERVVVPSDSFHTVTTTSSYPSCYFYIYHNTTDKSLQEKVEEYKRKVEGEDPWDSQLSDGIVDPMIVEMYQKLLARSNATKRTAVEKFGVFLMRKYGIFRRSFLVSYYAIRNLLFGRPNREQLVAERRYMDYWVETNRNAEVSNKADYRSKSEL